MVRLELLFGTSRPSGRPVTEQDWAAFLDSVVTPRFPSGLTVLSGAGQWRGGDGVVTKERSYILVIWHEPSRRSETDLAAIRSVYQQQFEQESVMQVESISCVSF